MNPDPQGTPGPAVGRAVLVGLLLLCPLAWVALEQVGHPGGGALDATGVLVLDALIPGALVGAVVGGTLSRIPASTGWGLALGLVAGAIVELLATALFFVSLLGG